jgi:hypothetical protein
VATSEEIRRRVEEADTARSATRSASAQQIGELAHRHATLAEQLADIERQLGALLTDAQDIIDVDELARFTDVPSHELSRWLAAARTARKTSRAKRTRPSTGTPSTENDARRAPSAAPASPAGQASTPPDAAGPRAGTDTASTRVPAEVA